MNALKLIQPIVHTNILISLAAGFLTFETQLQLNLGPHWHPYLFLIFTATLFEYNLHRLVTIRTTNDASISVKHRWAVQHAKMYPVLVVCSLIGLLIAVVQTPLPVLLALAPFACLTLLYSLPVSNGNNTLVRLRQVPYLKIFLVSITWSATTVLPPVIHHGVPLNDPIWMMLLERALFVFAITIPFDIRDRIEDGRQGLKTIPMRLGERRSRWLSVIALLAFTLLTSLHYASTDQVFLAAAFLLSALTTIGLITHERIRQLPLYHYGILDGTMLLQGVLVLGAYSFSMG